MLARTVLNPEELEILQSEHSALLKVRAMLASGELQHYRHGVARDYGFTTRKLFNMNHYCYPSDGWPICGTPRCIGGWMSVLQGHPWRSEKLRPLFHPRKSNENATISYNEITNEQAVEALDKFFAGAPVDEWWSHI